MGDVVGKPGRQAVREALPSLVASYPSEFVLANGENAAGGVGITPEIAEELFGYGVDGITLGNHAFHKADICGYLDSGKPIIRPANQPPSTPGKGSMRLRKGSIELVVINLCGRAFMGPYDDPFRAADALVAEAGTHHVLVDFHAEATSEKIAMAWYLDGRVSAVVGTHTHVPTADERILPRGTAAITDVGMTGSETGVLGMDREIVLRRFLTGLPARFEVAAGPGVISAVAINVNNDTGRAEGIERIRFECGT